MKDPKTEDIFLEAIQIADPEQREAFLESACGDDPGRRMGVEALLKGNERIVFFPT